MNITLQSWAWRTPLGSGVAARERILAGETALGPVPSALAAYGPAYIAQIPEAASPSPHGRYLHRLGLFAVEVAREAAGDRKNLGIFTAMGGLRALWEDLLVAMHDQTPDEATPWARGLGKVHPYWMLRHLSNNAHALIAMELGATGEGATFSGANAGAQALGAAIRTLRAGRLTEAIVVGYDTLLQPELLLEGHLAGRFSTTGPGEAAVALRIGLNGDGPAVAAEAGIIQGSLRGSPIPVSVEAALGQLGAATALAQVVTMAGLEPGIWVADSSGAPGLFARVQVRLLCKQNQNESTGT